MSDEEKSKSAWTSPPKGKAKKPKGNKANAQKRGRRHTAQRHLTAERAFQELRDGKHPHEPQPGPPLIEPGDYLPRGEPIPEASALQKQACMSGEAGTTYRSEYARIAKTICELGGTDVEVARALGVSMSTMWGWQSRHEEFFRAMIIGKDLPDERVIRSLYQRAVGYSYPDVEFKTHQGSVHVIPVMKHLPPDVGACQAWLRSRRKQDWNPASNLNLSADETFRNLWVMVAQGQVAPMLTQDIIDVTPEEAA